MWIHANNTVSLNTDTWERNLTESAEQLASQHMEVKRTENMPVFAYPFDYQRCIFQLILTTFNLGV